MAIKVVTDSTADLPSKVAADHEITVVPLNVHFGEEVYQDGVDIWCEEFYNRLQNEPVLPNTSQPAPGDFLKIYQKIAQPGDIIISLHISSEMSGTANSAKIAAELLGAEYQVIIIDSRTVSMGLGLLALKTARALKQGVPLEAVLDSLTEWQKNVVIYFTVNSLEHLHRTGRIGKATVMLGGLLNIKPVLSVEDGVIVPKEKIRGNFQKVALQMIEMHQQRFGAEPLIVSIMHTEKPEVMQQFYKLANERLNITEFIPNVFGPVVGAHTGPDTFGIIAIPVR